MCVYVYVFFLSVSSSYLCKVLQSSFLKLTVEQWLLHGLRDELASIQPACSLALRRHICSTLFCTLFSKANPCLPFGWRNRSQLDEPETLINADVFI